MVVLLEPEFLVFEGEAAINEVEINHPFHFIQLLIILVIEQFHVLHYKVPGLQSHSFMIIKSTYLPFDEKGRRFLLQVALTGFALDLLVNSHSSAEIPYVYCTCGLVC